MIHAASIEVVRPTRLNEALALMHAGWAAGRPFVPMAGGTDLLVSLNAGQPSAPARYLDLWGLRSLRYIERKGRTLSFGALATYTDCIRSREVGKLLPILIEAAREVGGVQIQNRGTLAGNVANASPAADAVPVLLAAGAVVVLGHHGGEREVPLESYYTGYRQSVRRPDELITELRVKVPRGGQSFRKVGPRAAQAISKVVMAQVGHRFAFGSVAPTTVLARNLERYLDEGGDDADAASRIAMSDIAPIDDQRSTAEYRRRVAGNLVAQWIRAR